MLSKRTALLGFELAPLKDELIHGWLARHQALARLTASQGFLKLVLDRRTLGGSPLLPTGLRELSERLPSGRYGHERLIADHTAFPYFASFGPADRVGRLAEGMRDGWSDRSQNVLGVTPVAQHATLLYCRTCRSEQLATLGAATWSRVHQAPGVFRCHMHEEPLMASPIKVKSSASLFTCPTGNEGPTPATSPLPNSSARRIARLTAHFMQNPRRIASRVQLRVGVSNLLRKAGWLHESGHARAHLWQTFAKHVGEETLEGLGCQRTLGNTSTSWIHNMIGAQTVGHHPLRYLLIFDFLGLEPSDLQNFPEAELDPVLRTGAPAHPRVELEGLTPELLALYRRGILKGVSDGLTRAEIQRKHTRRFRALLAFDRVWFDEHVPARGTAAPRSMKDNSEEDGHLTAVILAAISRLRNTGDVPPKRITLHSIATEAGLPTFEARKHRLPKSLRLGEAACESVEQHRVTLLHWAAERYRTEGASPSFAVFAKRAAFKPERFPTLRELARTIHGNLADSGRPRD